MGYEIEQQAARVVPVAEKGLGPAAASLADDLTPCTVTPTPGTNPVPALHIPTSGFALANSAVPMC